MASNLIVILDFNARKVNCDKIRKIVPPTAVSDTKIAELVN